MSDSDRRGNAVEFAGATLGAAVGAAIGGPVGSVIGAGATRPLTDLVGKAWDELRGRREANAVRVVAKAADQTGTEPGHLLAIALADPDLSRLLNAALQAAAGTLDQEKVDALARCLANGVEDMARVDQEALVVRALADLDPVHVRVLARAEGGAMKQRDVHRFLCGKIDVREFIDAADLSGPVLAVLERHGLGEPYEKINERHGGVYDRGPEVETRFRCTEFGRVCLERLGHCTRASRRRLSKQPRDTG